MPVVFRKYKYKSKLQKDRAMLPVGSVPPLVALVIGGILYDAHNYDWPLMSVDAHYDTEWLASHH